MNTTELKLAAARSRRNIVRMVQAGGSGHMGGAMSAVDIITALYFDKMNVDPKNPCMQERDRFLISAGHKAMAQYAVLAEKGFFSRELLDTYGRIGTALPGHPDMKKLPGIEANTGALGHGMAIGCGMALALKDMKKMPKVYIVMGDGELAEGSNWEAMAVAAHHRIGNLTVFLDRNRLQISGRTSQVMSYEPVKYKFRSFGWETFEIDGNRMEEITSLLEDLDFYNGRPKIVVADTVKSKGISFAEGKKEYHYWKPKGNELEEAFREVDETIRKLEEQLEEAE